MFQKLSNKVVTAFIISLESGENQLKQDNSNINIAGKLFKLRQIIILYKKLDFWFKEISNSNSLYYIFDTINIFIEK